MTGFFILTESDIAEFISWWSLRPSKKQTDIVQSGQAVKKKIKIAVYSCQLIDDSKGQSWEEG